MRRLKVCVVHRMRREDSWPLIPMAFRRLRLEALVGSELLVQCSVVCVSRRGLAPTVMLLHPLFIEVKQLGGVCTVQTTSLRIWPSPFAVRRPVDRSPLVAPRLATSNAETANSFSPTTHLTTSNMDSPTHATPSRQDMKVSPPLLPANAEIMELSAALSRSRQREDTLSLQLQSARTCSQDLLSDLITATGREEALRARAQHAEGRVLNAELDAAVYQNELARAVEHNNHLASLLGAGARVIERLDRQHIFELGVVEAGVRVATVLGARQPWVEEEKGRFVEECRQMLGEDEREVLLAYYPSAHAHSNGNHVGSSIGRHNDAVTANPDLLLPLSSGPPTPPAETKGMAGLGHSARTHARKPTDYDAALIQLIGAEAAQEFIAPAYPDCRLRDL